MAYFTSAAQRVLSLEGGYQDNPRDKGNYICRSGGWVMGAYPFRCADGSLPKLVGTKYGIAAPTLSDYLNRPATAADMKKLTKATATDIYRANYWTRIKGDLIDDQSVAELIFDAAINHGNSAAIRLTQQVLKVPVDSIMGGQTLNALNAADPATFYRDYKDARISLYNSIVANDPSQRTFYQGWINRLDDFDDYGTFGIGSGFLTMAVVLIGLLIFRI